MEDSVNNGIDRQNLITIFLVISETGIACAALELLKASPKKAFAECFRGNVIDKKSFTNWFPRRPLKWNTLLAIFNQNELLAFLFSNHHEKTAHVSFFFFTNFFIWIRHEFIFPKQKKIRHKIVNPGENSFSLLVALHSENATARKRLIHGISTDPDLGRIGT